MQIKQYIAPLSRSEQKSFTHAKQFPTVLHVVAWWPHEMTIEQLSNLYLPKNMNHAILDLKPNWEVNIQMVLLDAPN